MLKRFFKPKWQHQDLPVRQQALAALDIDEDAEIIIKMASEDPSNELRCQALAKITDYQVIQSMLIGEEDPGKWCVIATRLNELLNLDAESLAKNEQLAKSEPSAKNASSAKNKQPTNNDDLIAAFGKAQARWSKEDIFKAIAACRDIHLANDLLMAMKDPDALLKIATSAKSIELRLKAVAEIQDTDVLHKLSKQASHKRVLQVVRQKLNEAKLTQQLIRETHEQAERLCLAMNKLAAQTWLDTQLENKVNSLVNQWQRLDQSLLQSKADGFRLSLEECQQVIATNQKEFEQATLEQEAFNKQQGLCVQLQDLIGEMNSRENQSLEAVQLVKDALVLLEESWHQVSAAIKPDIKVSDEFSRLQQKLIDRLAGWEKFATLKPDFLQLFELEPENKHNELDHWLKSWKKLEKQLQWPKNRVRPVLLDEWQAQTSKYQEQFEKIVSSQKKKLSRLNQKLAVLDKHLRQRNLIAANKLSNYINLQLSEYVGEFRNSVIRKLENIQPRLDELRDWHAFATTPKKQSLCEAMEQLSQESSEPLVKAKQMRELQEKWRELIASDANADQELWERFKQASDLAYEPCLEFYAEQDKIKAGHLQQRIRICESLEKIVAETDWNNPDRQNDDWKTIDKDFIKANREWQQHHSVPENERQSIQKRFNKISRVIRDYLNDEKQSNLDARCELVEKANKLIIPEELVNKENVDKAINAAMRLQKQWKELGITFFKADRDQWQLFRKAIDQVYNQRKMLKQLHLQDLRQNQQKLMEITQQISTLCELDDNQLKQSYEQFEALRESWDPELELPRANSPKVLNAFEFACQKYQSHYSGLGQRLEKMALNSLIQGVNQLQQAEECLLEGGLFDKDELRQQIADCSCRESDKKRLHVRLENLLTTDNAEENKFGLSELEALALKAEILVGIDSPIDCKEQRMSFQLEQLKQGLGNQNSNLDKQKEILQVYKKWIAIGFITKTKRAELEERRAKFFSAVAF